MITPENNSIERDYLNLAIWQRAHELAVNSPLGVVLPPSYAAHPDLNMIEAISSHYGDAENSSKDEYVFVVEPLDDETLYPITIPDAPSSSLEQTVVAISLANKQRIAGRLIRIARGYTLRLNGDLAREITIDDPSEDFDQVYLYEDVSIPERHSLLSELVAIEVID